MIRSRLKRSARAQLSCGGLLQRQIVIAGPLHPPLARRYPSLSFSHMSQAYPVAIVALPTVWIPHSYGGCSQHAPNEHLLALVVREALGVMAGVWWDIGEQLAARPKQ